MIKGSFAGIYTGPLHLYISAWENNTIALFVAVKLQCKAGQNNAIFCVYIWDTRRPFFPIFHDCIQPFGHEMLSWVRLHGINARIFSPQPAIASWYQFTLHGEQVVHQRNSSLSRAISQTVGSLGNRTGDPSVSGPIASCTIPIYGTIKWQMFVDVVSRRRRC